jgi:hypothetical protein
LFGKFNPLPIIFIIYRILNLTGLEDLSGFIWYQLSKSFVFFLMLLSFLSLQKSKPP